MTNKKPSPLEIESYIISLGAVREHNQMFRDEPQQALQQLPLLQYHMRRIRHFEDNYRFADGYLEVELE